MATPPAVPVNIVSSGGIAVTQVASDAKLGRTMTPTTKPGLAVTLVANGGQPVALVNEDGSDYVP